MGKTRVWYDEEGDFLEVTFANRRGSFREIGPDLYERIDTDGHVVGFAVFNFLKRVPIEFTPVAARH